MFVDGVGFFVRYNNDQEHMLTPENMRCYLMSRRRTWCVIRASTPAKAVEKFYREWKGSTGGSIPEKNALWIDTNDDEGTLIEEFPKCSHLYLTRKDQPRCGGWGDRYTMDCVIDGQCYPPDECPIEIYRQKLHRLDTKEISFDYVEDNGIRHKVLRYCKLGPIGEKEMVEEEEEEE
jgi:hypothetical protein